MLLRHDEAVAWRLAATVRDVGDDAALLWWKLQLRLLLLVLKTVVGVRKAAVGANRMIPVRQSSALRRKIIDISNPSGDI